MSDLWPRIVFTQERERICPPGVGIRVEASPVTCSHQPNQLSEIQFDGPARRPLFPTARVPGSVRLARFLRRSARRTTFLSADLYAVEVSCWGQDGRSGHSDCKR